MPDAVQTDLKQKMDKAYQNLLTEYQGMRTGRAHPAMLDNVKVSAYGQQLPVHNVASVTVADARTLKVNVWDGNNLQAVESAIRKADLGVNPRTDGTTIYISLPDLTEERRSEMVKLLKKKNEDCKISIRNIRREANDQVKKQEKDKEISEDELNDSLEEIQKITDSYVTKIDDTTENKINEITTI